MSKRWIIAFGGMAEHGKSTCSKIASEYLAEKKYPSIRLAFAGRLKEAVKILFRLGDSDVYTSEGKQKIQPHLGSKCTARIVLQKFGSDVMRDTLSTTIPELECLNSNSIWVWNIEQDIIENKDMFIIIEDVRFPDEEKMLRYHEAFIINVVRPNYGNAAPTHQSETSHSLIKFDNTIINDSTLDELRVKLISILDKLLINEG